MIKRKSYLDCFPTIINTYSEYTWKNGEYGAMILEVIKDDLQVDEYFYGFANMEGDNRERNIRIWEERKNKQMHMICTGRPILFGIAAYWILHHTGIPITNLYEDYLRDKIDAYKRKHEQEVSSRKRNIELDFYTNYIVPKELEKIQMSEEIFDYVTPEDTKKLKGLMDDFVDYLKEKRTEMGYVDNPLLKVLRYMDSGDKFVLEDMPDYEFITTCDELEKGGYINVAWVEGHRPESVKLLDKGRFYLELLEKEGAAKSMHLSNDNKPTIINGQKNNGCIVINGSAKDCTIIMSPATPSTMQKPKIAKTKTGKPKTKKGKKPSGKPMTLKYYKHGNNGELMRQRKRVHQVFKMWNRWGWIDEQTTIEDFDAFFEGVPKHCNITWTGSNTTILTIMLQELLKQSYFEEQTGCAARSLVEQQFGKTANFDRTRLDNDMEEKINLTLLVLDPKNHDLIFQSSDNLSGRQDIQDAALIEIFSGQLHSSKGV